MSIGSTAHKVIVLLNPNTSAATTTMMTGIAERAFAALGTSRIAIHGVTAAGGPGMITNQVELAASADHVVQGARRALSVCQPVDGFIVAAFGDPGLERLASVSDIPVVGIAEAAMREAAHGHRRFGVATTTPGLVASIESRVRELGLAESFTGVRLTAGAPLTLAAAPMRQTRELGTAVQECVRDGAEAVVIGGGPLGESADGLQESAIVPVIAPIPAACRRMLELL